MIRRTGISRAMLCAAGALWLCTAAAAKQDATTAPTAAPSSTAAVPANAAPVANTPASTGATAAGTPGAETNANSRSSSGAGESPVREDRALLIEGEKRFATNCGRCHQAPHKFPPRVLATAVRHMRVRATITDEDMRLILRYMTQ